LEVLGLCQEKHQKIIDKMSERAEPSVESTMAKKAFKTYKIKL
jgi:hypothetical protein